MNQLEQLKKFTTVVADTGDFSVMKEYLPQDATTNPSLILQAVKQEKYKNLFEETIKKAKEISAKDTVKAALDEVIVAFGKEILEVIPGRVSTETDARLSFDTDGTIAKARELIKMYENAGYGRERILIKIASTWEGIKAAEILEKEGIHCNLTLMFSIVQAVACANAKVQLISPFVGRIYDWYKKNFNRDYHGAEDPGVQSVIEIYNYYKKFDFKTEVMGASFRNKTQITELAGCDLLTISPSLLEELQNSNEKISKKLDEKQAQKANIEKIEINEKIFRYQLNDEAMAIEKTAEGIRRFAEDTVKLEKIISDKLSD